jgi:hypothetical protein
MSKQFLTQAQIIEKLQQGWELGMSNTYTKSNRVWMQKQLCKGGDSLEVRVNTLWSLRRNKKIVDVPRKENDPFWLTRYALNG